MANARKRGARARNVSRNIWLSSAEERALLERAGKQPLSAWLRDLALGQPTPPATKLRRNSVSIIGEAMAPLERAIAKVGNNLNQIARQANANALAGRVIDVVQIRVALASISAEMRQIREEAKRACEGLSARRR
jgi:Bacterial mobilisation protein (MobC)